jgi:cell division protein FtsL
MPIEVHLEKRIINNNVVRETDGKSYKDYIVVTVLGTILLLGLFAYAWQHYRWIQFGYRIEEAQKKKEQLAEVGRRLRLEKASLRSPQRIDALARRDLGMVVPAPGQLVTFTADAPLTIPVPQPPQPIQPQQAAVQPQSAALTVKR